MKGQILAFAAVAVTAVLCVAGFIVDRRQKERAQSIRISADHANGPAAPSECVRAERASSDEAR